MTPDQLQALTWLACETRKETHGAAPWDKPGTHALIERHCGSWGFNLAVEHVLAHARDPKARTPAVIVGPMPHTTPERGHRHPVKAGSPDECPTHQGQPTDNCSGCTADRLARTPGNPANHPDLDGLTGRELFAQVRQELDLRNALERRPA